MGGIINFLQTFDAPAGGFLLDDYPNAAWAYSLRYLRTAYIGSPVIRVRRSSDSVQQDFTPTEITDGTLTTFTGANDGFVTIWYDQSINGRDAIQTDTLRETIIVISGVLVLNNGLPAIQTTGETRSGFIALDKSTLSFLHESEATWSLVLHRTNNGIISRSTGNPGLSLKGYHFATSVQITIMNGSGVDYALRYDNLIPNIINQTFHYLWDYDLTQPTMPLRSSFYYNDILHPTGNTVVGNPGVGVATSDPSLIGIIDNRFYQQNKYQEWIVWDSRLDSERTAIQDNINAYYNIY